MHFEGAIQKDGPPQNHYGDTLVSALCNVPVRHDVAMTGEITLRGRVLRLGSARKALATHRAGVTSIIIQNEKDIEDVPAVTKGGHLYPVRHADKVLENYLIHGGQLWKVWYQGNGRGGKSTVESTAIRPLHEGSCGRVAQLVSNGPQAVGRRFDPVATTFSKSVMFE